jgi:hypothetical protein
MKNTRSLNYRCWRPLLIAICIPVFANVTSTAQTVKRESIGSIGAHGHSGRIYFQASIGQPYGTTAYAPNAAQFRPGFQQPAVFSNKLMHSTFPVAVNVYPNPAASSITIKSEEVIGRASIGIRDANGNPLLNEQVDGFTAYSVNCGMWAPGFYFITVRDEKNNRQYSSKLIITK